MMFDEGKISGGPDEAKNKERPRLFPSFPDPELPEWVHKEGLPMWSYSRLAIFKIIEIGQNPETRKKLWELDDLLRSVHAIVEADARNFPSFRELFLYVTINGTVDHEFTKKLAEIMGPLNGYHIWVQIITARRLEK